MPRNLRLDGVRVSGVAVLKLGIILSLVGWAVLYSLTVSVNLPTLHLDGAFQTASGLYRLAAGQLPGQDFFPYLGIGPLYALYPTFKLLGSNLAASFFSAQFVVLISGALSTAFIWHLIWRPASFITSLAAGSLLFLAPIAVAQGYSMHLAPWMIFYVSPGASLRPIRAMAPILVAASYYFFIHRLDSERAKYAFSGLLTGVALLWSNDFAIPTAGLFVCLVCAQILHSSASSKKNLSVYLGVSILSWMSFLMLTTSGHAMEFLKYNFIDVAHDQWWYFGPFEEESRIFTVDQLPRLLTHHNNKILLVLALTAGAAYRTRLVEHALLLWLGLAALSGGVVASIGGHLGNYFDSFYFWGVLVALLGTARLCWLAYQSLAQNYLKFPPLRLQVFPLVILFGGSAYLAFSSFDRYEEEIHIAQTDSKRFFVPELGGYLPIEWADYVARARASSGKVVFEEYWGLWSAILRVFPEWNVDSVIHALGSKRTYAKSELANAALMITTREDILPLWVGWNISENYWFYQDLLREWTPLLQSPLTTVWQRTRPKSEIDVPCRIVARDKFEVFAREKGLLGLEVRYSFGGSRSLVFIRNNLDYSAVATGYVSVDPHGHTASIPAFASVTGSNIYDAQVLPRNNSDSFILESCSAKEIPGMPVYGKSIVAPNEKLSNGAWLTGISLKWAGFLVPNQKKYIDQYRVGRLVRFENGHIREITRVEPDGLYLSIFLNGEILCHEKVGLPTNFVVFDGKSLDRELMREELTSDQKSDR